MEYQQRLTARLLATRGFTDRLLEDFTQPGDWVYQMNENGNHALWFVGHMGVTDNFMISLIDAEKTSTNTDKSSTDAPNDAENISTHDHFTAVVTTKLRR